MFGNRQQMTQQKSMQSRELNKLLLHFGHVLRNEGLWIMGRGKTTTYTTTPELGNKCEDENCRTSKTYKWRPLSFMQS